MRIIVWILLLAIVAIVAAGTLGANDGTVTIQWQSWLVDISLNFFVVGVAATCLAIYAVVQAIDSLLGLPKRAQQWRITRRDRTAQAALRQALALLLAGRFSRAHKQAQRAVEIQALTPELEPDAEFSALGHMLSASALHRLQDQAQRDEHLAQALNYARQTRRPRPCEEAAKLLSAEWALDDHDAGRALQELNLLPPGLGRRTLALRLKLQAARLSGQPLEALRTARLLAKHQGISAVAAEGLIRTLAIDVLEAARDADQLRRQWQALDPADRRDPYVAARAVTLLAQAGAADEARMWMRPFWDKLSSLKLEERSALALALAQSSVGIEVEWVALLESAMHTHPREPMIAYAVGRCLAERQLWGKAKRLLENAARDPDLTSSCRRDAWLILAKLAEEIQDREEAAFCYRQAAVST